MWKLRTILERIRNWGVTDDYYRESKIESWKLIEDHKEKFKTIIDIDKPIFEYFWMLTAFSLINAVFFKLLIEWAKEADYFNDIFLMLLIIFPLQFRMMLTIMYATGELFFVYVLRFLILVRLPITQNLYEDLAQNKLMRVFGFILFIGFYIFVIRIGRRLLEGS